MTIGVLIESLFLKVNGGRPTPNDTIMRVDIKAFLPAAINYAMESAHNIELASDGDRDFPSEFYSVFEGMPIDWSGNIPFIELTLGTVPLKGGAGLRFVYDNCQHLYTPVPDSEWANIGYYSSITKGMYWFRRTGIKLYLYGLKFSPLIESINYQAITKVEDLDDSDEAPLQAGTETIAIKYMAEWFDKKFPYTTKVDGNDINAQPV